MPYYIYKVSSRGYVLIDEKGHIYNQTPQSKKKCQAQQRAVEANKHSKIKGKGLTLSKMYLDSWYFDIPVRVCEIFDVNETIYGDVIHRNRINNWDIHLPKQKYFYIYGTLVDTKALKLPYRIYITSTDDRRGGIWYIEDNEDFKNLSKEFIKTGRGHRFDRIIQQPSGEVIAEPLDPIHEIHPPARLPPKPKRRNPLYPYNEAIDKEDIGDDDIPKFDTFETRPALDPLNSPPTRRRLTFQ